jgi:hypothetical protein
VKKETDCTHESLFFGSGNYYVFCRECPASWVHRGSGAFGDGSPMQAQTDQPVSDAASARCLPGDRTAKQDDVFECRYCGKQVDAFNAYHSDERGLWHWDCGPAKVRR